MENLIGTKPDDIEREANISVYHFTNGKDYQTRRFGKILVFIFRPIEDNTDWRGVLYEIIPSREEIPGHPSAKKRPLTDEELEYFKKLEAL